MHSDTMDLYRFVKVSVLAVGLAGLTAQTLSADSAPTKDAPPDLRAAINRTIGRDQAAYHFRTSGSGCFEARSALGTDVRVGPKGLTVKTGAGAWTLGAFAPSASGNTPAPGLAHQTAPNRVDVDRGWATEWVVNGPSGLEQGWTIPKRPSWAAKGDALLIPLEQDDTLRAVATEADGRALCVRDAQGMDILRYAGLTVTDAAGRELPARFETRPGDGALSIKVTDTGAVYPITIDPWVESAKLVASDRQQADHLGCSVALSADGRICAVGAYGSAPGGTYMAGAVYIFTNAADNWAGVSNEATKLVASDRQANDLLGNSVALSADGRICAVGTPQSSSGGTNMAGAVYIFTSAAGSWTGVSNEIAKLFASDRQAFDNLGYSVALSSNGEVCAAGTPKSAPGGTNQAGAVYIFTNAGGSWAGVSNQTTKLFASDRQWNDNLGYSVALSANGGICAASAYKSSPGGTNVAGAVYIFTNAAGNWTGVSNQTTKLFASDRQADDYLGYSVALSANGGMCAAGAINASPGNVTQAGAVYIFTNAAGNWAGVSNQTAKLIASDRQAYDGLGKSVALSANGGMCAAGAWYSSPGGKAAAGAVYIFTNTADSWASVSNEAAKLLASDRQADDNFGSSVALSADGGICAAGAFWSSPGGTTQAGAVYINVPPIETAWLEVAILNANAVAAGAQWRVDGGAWRASLTIATGLTAGAHTVNYSVLTNYTAPADQVVTLTPNQLATVEGTYTYTINQCYWPACADYDGDHKADPSTFYPGLFYEGMGWWRRRISSGNYQWANRPFGYGAPNWMPMGADFDGDRKADLGVYLMHESMLGVLFSKEDFTGRIVLESFGNDSYTALAADFDGDRLADPTLYNPATGDWKVRLSTAGYHELTLPNLLGGTGFAATGGDMDGDGIGDPFVCNMETGQCITMFSSMQYARFASPEGFLGTPGWLLALADYDGDGKADPAIYNPQDGTLVVRFSTGGYNPPITFPKILDPNAGN